MHRLRSVLITALLLSAFVVSYQGEAEPDDGMRRVAVLYSTSPVSEMSGPNPVHPSMRELRRALNERGWTEGQNLILERRSAEGQPERYEPILRELVRLKCDVLVIPNTLIAQVARKVTATVPIVLSGVGDPVRSGLVTNFARPGGNITGVTATNPDLDSKRLELLKQALPNATRVVILLGPEMASAEPYL